MYVDIDAGGEREREVQAMTCFQVPLTRVQVPLTCVQVPLTCVCVSSAADMCSSAADMLFMCNYYCLCESLTCTCGFTCYYIVVLFSSANAADTFDSICYVSS